MNEESIWQCRYVIPSVPAKSREILNEMLAKLTEQEWADQDVFAVHLALEEALMNAIKHGNKLDHSKSINVMVKLTADTLTATVTDEGQGFDPAAVPDCTDDDRLEIPSGRGLLLMRSFMKKVTYNVKGNAVTLEKARAIALAS